MNKFNNLLSEIREYIYDSRKVYILLSISTPFDKLNSSLDTISDTEKAFESFLHIDLPDDTGNNYLLIYGVLQALVVQQDAVQHLYESLKISYSRDSCLLKVREIRNAAIGHPTERNRTKESNFSATFNSNCFRLMTTYPDGRPPSFQNVNITEIMTEQRGILEQDIFRILEKLKQEEREHREMFKEQKLKDIFHGINYSIQKIYESIYANRPNKFGESHVNLISGVIDKFKESLEKRGILKIYNSTKFIHF